MLWVFFIGLWDLSTEAIKKTYRKLKNVCSEQSPLYSARTESDDQHYTKEKHRQNVCKLRKSNANNDNNDLYKIRYAEVEQELEEAKRRYQVLNDWANHKCQKMEVRIDKLEADETKYINKIRSLEGYKNQLLRRYAKVEQECKEEKTNYQRLNQWANHTFQEMQARIDQLEADEARYAEAEQDLEEEKERYQTMNDWANHRCQNMASRIDKLEADETKYINKIRSLNDDNKELLRRYAVVERGLQQAKEQCQRLSSWAYYSKFQEMQARIDELEADENRYDVFQYDLQQEEQWQLWNPWANYTSFQDMKARIEQLESDETRHAEVEQQLEEDKRYYQTMIERANHKFQKMETRIDKLEADESKYIKKIKSLDDYNNKLLRRNAEVEHDLQQEKTHYQTWTQTANLTFQEMQAKINQLEADKARHAKVEQELKEEKTSYQNLNKLSNHKLKEMQAKIYYLESDVSKYSNEIKILDEDKKELLKRYAKVEQELKREKTQYQKLTWLSEHKFQNMQSRIDKLEADEAKYGEKIKSLDEDKKEILRRSAKVQEELEQAKTNVQALNQRTCYKCEEMQMKINQLEADEAKYREQIKSLDDEKSKLLRRLSVIASAKLSDNVTLTDLSDINRPQKIGERYSDLYDSEWTDAFKYLEEQNEESMTAIIKLLNTVKHCFQFCQHNATVNLDVLLLAATNPMCHRSPTDTSTRLVILRDRCSTEVSQRIVDMRKATAKLAIPLVKEEFYKKLKEFDGVKIVKGGDCIQKYVDKCVEICWYASVQDPPLVIATDFPPYSPFDCNVTRNYTKSGKYVEYVVWPALLLHDKGPLLSKGVVQCTHKGRR